MRAVMHKVCRLDFGDTIFFMDIAEGLVIPGEHASFYFIPWKTPYPDLNCNFFQDTIGENKT